MGLTIDIETLSPAITAAIYAGLNIGAKLTDVVPNCASGNCTWDPYDSLALCANTVTNLTHLLTRTPAGTDPSDCSLPVPTYGHFCNYSLPNGAFLMAQNELVNITTGIGHTIAFPNSSVILDFFMIYYSPELRDFAAIEASVGFCGQTFDSSVKNGQINTTEVGRWGKLNTSVDPSEFLGMLPVVGNGITLYVEVAYENALLDTLKDIFSGDYFVNESGNKHFSTVAVEALYNSITGSQSQDDLASLQAFTDNFALSVSNRYTISNSTLSRGC